MGIGPFVSATPWRRFHIYFVFFTIKDNWWILK